LGAAVGPEHRRLLFISPSLAVSYDIGFCPTLDGIVTAMSRKNYRIFNPPEPIDVAVGLIRPVGKW